MSPGFYASVSSVALSSLILGFVGFGGFSPLPPSRPPSPPSKVDTTRVARHSLSAQALIVQRLIVVLRLNFRVSYSPVNCPDSYVVAALRNCFGLDVLIQGGFVLLTCPQPKLSSKGTRLQINGNRPSDSAYSSATLPSCSLHSHPLPLYYFWGHTPSRSYQAG